MRLVRVGLGSIDTTVGAFRENTDRALALAHDMAADGVTVGVFPEQPIGGYPVEDPIQWQGFVERQWAELERFARETASLATVFVIGVSVLHDGLRYNCAATSPAGPYDRCPRRRSCPPTTSSTKGAPSPAACREPSRMSAACPSAISSSASTSARSPRGVRGPLEPRRAHARRTYSGAELVCNLSASPFRLGRGADPARADRHPRRRLPVHVRLRQSRSAPTTGSSSTAAAIVNQNGKWMLEAPRWREGFAAAIVDLDRTPAAARREHHLAHRRETCLADHAPVTTIDVPGRVQHARARAALTYPVPAHGSLLPPRSPRRGDRRARSLRGDPRRAGAGGGRLLREERRRSS